MPDVRDGAIIDVWFSCGAASAVAAKETLDLFGGRCEVRIINNPVLEEPEDNRRFLRDVSDWLGRPILSATNAKWPTNSARDVWDKERYMSGTKGAPCTRALKKGARQEWESKNPADWLVMGFTADERRRHDLFALFERPTILPVLIARSLTKPDCFGILERAGLRLPDSYAKGYPNANCTGCTKATSPTYWNHVRQVDPDVFQDRAEQSRRLGVRLVRVKGERRFLDELPPDAKGRPMKSAVRNECGIFCEERRIPHVRLVSVSDTPSSPNEPRITLC